MLNIYFSSCERKIAELILMFNVFTFAGLSNAVLGIYKHEVVFLRYVFFFYIFKRLSSMHAVNAHTNFSIEQQILENILHCILQSSLPKNITFDFSSRHCTKLTFLYWHLTGLLIPSQSEHCVFVVLTGDMKQVSASKCNFKISSIEKAFFFFK